MVKYCIDELVVGQSDGPDGELYDLRAGLQFDVLFACGLEVQHEKIVKVTVGGRRVFRLHCNRMNMVKFGVILTNYGKNGREILYLATASELE